MSTLTYTIIQKVHKNTEMNWIFESNQIKNLVFESKHIWNPNMTLSIFNPNGQVIIPKKTMLRALITFQTTIEIIHLPPTKKFIKLHINRLVPCPNLYNAHATCTSTGIPRKYFLSCLWINGPNWFAMSKKVIFKIF
jgi:hypothetical protein